METIKFFQQDDRSAEDSCVVYYFEKYIYGLILKDESSKSVTDSNSFDEMLDYGICNVTYRLDKIERLLYELDYEVTDVTNQIFVNFP